MQKGSQIMTKSSRCTNMIFLNVCPESNDLWWKFPKDRLCYFLYEHCEMSAKLHLLRMWVCLSCMMVIWKVLLRQWWLWGPAAAIRLEKSSKICGGRSLKAGRGRQGRPNNAQARPNTHHLPPQHSVHVFTQITNSLLKSTLHSSKGGG